MSEAKPYSPPAPIVQGAAKKRALFLILIVMLMDIIGLTILIPVAPFIVKRYSSDAFTISMLSGIYAAASFVAAPALGHISDRVGRRPVLLLSVLGSAIGYFIFGLGGALWVLFLSRLIDGITGGNFSTASAYIADVSTVEDRPKNFALIGVAWGFGFVLGPVLSAVTSLISIDAPAFAAGLLSLASVILMLFALPESLPKERRLNTPLTLGSFNPLLSIRDVARKPGMPILLVVICIYAFVFNGISSIFSKFLAERFTVDATAIATLWVFAGLVIGLTQSFFVPRMVRTFGETVTTAISLVGLGLGSALAAVVPTFAWVYPTFVIRSGLGGLFWASTGSLTASKMQPHEQGRLAGVNSALQNLMAVFGPLAAGASYDLISPAAPLALGLLILIVGGGVALLIRPTPERADAGAAWGG